MTAQFRVPLALDENRMLSRPEDAVKGQVYYCPSCGDAVILRKGEIKVAHFAHKVSNTCSQETILHQIAKLLIQQAVQEWKSGKANAPILRRGCRVCYKGIDMPLPDRIDTALLEYRLPDGSVADVALLEGNEVVAAVEIRVTHAVEEEKAKRLPVHFVELDGESVIANPQVWMPVSHNLTTLTCTMCGDTYRKFWTKAKIIAERMRITLPTSYYRYGICDCWRCGKEILVFLWPKDGLHDAKTPSGMPMPKTIQLRYSKMAHGEYWVNTCPFCNSIQGDFFLYMEPDSPFFGTHISGESPEDFKHDMMKIAFLAYSLGLLTDK
ncbi:MAG: competence protein CoiA family protein [Armatimonadota bacterium]